MCDTSSSSASESVSESNSGSSTTTSGSSTYSSSPPFNPATASEILRQHDLTSSTVLITGCNTGIGKAAAAAFLHAGAHVVFLVRSVSRGQAALDDISSTPLPPSAGGDVVRCDLGDMESVEAAVATLSTLSCITSPSQTVRGVLLNAGVMGLPKRKLSSDKIEMTFAVSVMGHLGLVGGCLDAALLPRASRVVWVSSGAHANPSKKYDPRLVSASPPRSLYDSWGAYQQAKLVQILLCRHRAAIDPRGPSWIALHPGVIKTDLGRYASSMDSMLSEYADRDIDQGAATSVYAMVAPDIASGSYLSECALESPGKYARDPKTAQRAYRACLSLLSDLSPPLSLSLDPKRKRKSKRKSKPKRSKHKSRSH